MEEENESGVVPSSFQEPYLFRRRKSKRQRITTMSSSPCQFSSCSPSGNQSVSVGEREGETFSDLTRRAMSLSSTSGENSDQPREAGRVVDLTNDSGVEDAELVDLTSPISNIGLHSQASYRLVNRQEGGRERGGGRRRRRRRARDVVVLDDESDDSTDEVQILEPELAPQVPQATPDEPAPEPQSPTKKLLKCPICMENAATFERRGSQVVVTVCGHVFCSLCIRRSITEQRRCPTCRKRLTIRQFHPLYLSV